MGLITKEVEIVIGASNVAYYESLGYIIPRSLDKYGDLRLKKDTKIRVKTEHLQPCNSAIVERECDLCHEIKKIKYSSYIKGLHKDGSSYCSKCAHTKFCSGENHHAWNNTLTEEERIFNRRTPGYIDFIKTVLSRDNYTCQCCGKKSTEDLEVHHLNGYNWCVNERTDPNNGITLCEVCHKNFHSKYGSGNNTKEQFEEWFGKTIELFDDGVPITSARKIYCYEDNIVYENVNEFIESQNINKNSFANVYNACNYVHSIINNEDTEYQVKTVYGKHVMWHDDYLKIDNNDLQKLIYLKLSKGTGKAVICTTTNKIFFSTSEAGSFYNCSKESIGRCCNKKASYCGHLKDGTILSWMWYKDYILCN